MQVLADGLLAYRAGPQLAGGYVLGNGTHGIAQFGTATVIHAHGQLAALVILGQFLSGTQLVDDRLPEFGLAAGPADAHTPGVQGIALAAQHVTGEAHEEADFLRAALPVLGGESIDRDVLDAQFY